MRNWQTFLELLSNVSNRLTVKGWNNILRSLISNYDRFLSSGLVDVNKAESRTFFEKYYWPFIRQMPYVNYSLDPEFVENTKLTTILKCAGKVNFQFVFDFAYFVYLQHSSEESDDSPSKQKLLYGKDNSKVLYEKIPELIRDLGVNDDSIDYNYLRDILLFTDEMVGNQDLSYAKGLVTDNIENSEFLMKFILSFTEVSSRQADIDDESESIEDINVDLDSILKFVGKNVLKTQVEILSRRERLKYPIKRICLIILDQLAVHK